MAFCQIGSGQIGCAQYNSNQANCNDPLPVVNTTGTWNETDESGNQISTWTIVNGGSSSIGATGQVSGTVDVVPITIGCPHIAYKFTGTFTPNAPVSGTPGSTSFSFTATNPNPSGSCGGNTPVASQTFSGTFTNKNNDNSNGTEQNSSGITDTISPSGPYLFVRTAIQPTGETTVYNGPDPITTTEFSFSNTLTGDNSGSNNVFYGRQVFEKSGSTPASDGCYTGTGKAYPYGPLSITGSAWNVGWTGNTTGGQLNNAPNQWGQDAMGYPPGALHYYRTNKFLPGKGLPCVATFTQSMHIITTDGTNPSADYVYYANHSMKITLSLNSVSMVRDGKTYVIFK